MRDKHSAEDILFVVVTVVLSILILGSFMMMLLTKEKDIPRISFFVFGAMLNVLLAAKNLTRGKRRGYLCIAVAAVCAGMAVFSLLKL